jgi:hypothetical protein
VDVKTRGKRLLLVECIFLRKNKNGGHNWLPFFIKEWDVEVLAKQLSGNLIITIQIPLCQ